MINIISSHNCQIGINSGSAFIREMVLKNAKSTNSIVMNEVATIDLLALFRAIASTYFILHVVVARLYI